MEKDFDYQKELIKCYSAQAEHFHNTRKKFWPEVDLMRDELAGFIASHESDQESISLVDLGCGSGRLSERLLDGFDVTKISYLGVDNAPGMTEIASKEYPNHEFLCKDMIGFATEAKQESIDVLIALASIQHIQGVEKQQELLLGIYKSLKRGGKAILVNRSFSERFLKKYRKLAVASTRRSIIKPGRAWNDLLIPRKDKSYHQNNTSYERMYHIYSLHELRQLCRKAGFIIEKSGYVHQDGSFGNDRKRSRNSVVVVRKDIG